VQGYLSVGQRLQPADQIQQGGFTRPAPAYQCNGFACNYPERYAVKDGGRGLTASVAVRQVINGNGYRFWEGCSDGLLRSSLRIDN